LRIIIAAFGVTANSPRELELRSGFAHAWAGGFATPPGVEMSQKRTGDALLGLDLKLVFVIP